jgi:hypothetical protein
MRLKPAKKTRVAYPSLLAMGGALFAGGHALADASIPSRPGEAKPPARIADNAPPETPRKPHDPTEKKPTPPDQRKIPKLAGKIACPRKPGEIDLKLAEPVEKPAPKLPEPPRPKGDIARASKPMVIHPHAPWEPCFEGEEIA